MDICTEEMITQVCAVALIQFETELLENAEKELATISNEDAQGTDRVHAERNGLLGRI